MEYVKAFITGGLLCVIGQILLQRTKLTPARIVVIYVAAGAFLTAVGLYRPLVEWAGAGATVPLTGFGYTPKHKQKINSIQRFFLSIKPKYSKYREHVNRLSNTATAR